MISNYEMQYITILKDIFEHGYEDGVNDRTGKSTKRLPGRIIQVDVEKEFPILKSKQVFARTAQREIEWIWKIPSNNINDLKANIWDAWADEDGSIGKAYGFQAAKPVEIYLDPINKTPESFRHYDSQIEFIIEYLRECPTGRWGVITLWNVAELKEMNLVPCCHTSTWNLDGGRLNCVLDQRSGDMPYGVPFNTTQYAQLMHMVAKELGVKPGILTHVIADAHIYDNQMDGVRLQLSYFDLLECWESFNDDALLESKVKIMIAEFKENPESWWFTNGEVDANVIIARVKNCCESVPEFMIESDKSFFEYFTDDCKVLNYANMGKVDFGEIAV